MKKLTGFSTDPKQTSTFVLDDGSFVSVYMEYRPQQLGWFMDLVWGDRTISGLRLTASPNFLYKWKGVLPFGLALLVTGNAEPLRQNDFSDGTAVMYLLNAEDMVMVEETSFVGL